MSSNSVRPSSTSVDELEWIELRKELDTFHEKEKDFKRYKFNWYIPLGVVITGAFYTYGVLNMFDMKKSTYAAYARITSQCIVGTVFVAGCMEYLRSKQKKYSVLNKR